MFLGPNKTIFGRFGDHMDTMNTSTPSRGRRMRFNVNTRVPDKVTAFFLTVRSTVFEDEIDF